MKISGGNAFRRRQIRRFAGQHRRSFLRHCWKTTAALLLRPVLRATTATGRIHSEAEAPGTVPANSEFLFEPHYRERAPLDDALLQIRAGRDGFAAEAYHDRIASILSEWQTTLLKSPPDFQPIAEDLSRDFQGTSWQAASSQPLRPPSLSLEVHRLSFGLQTALGPEVFLSEMRVALDSFAQIVTAQFQITRITGDASRVVTEVRYEMVGKGRNFYREQRVGFWSIDWLSAPGGGYSATRWQVHDEVRARAAQPLFSDVTARAFGGNVSYDLQLVHGADYWRTVLDSACGIDIYGHNGVSVGDIVGDGFDDVYVCQPAGLPNRLYRNRGDGIFEDVTERSGLGVLENTACALIADFDNDGRQDLVVVTANGPQFFHNEGHGTFLARPGAFHFAKPPQGTFTGAAAADYNRDGRLDIYFCLYVYYQGTDQYKYPTPYYAAENGPPNFLMHNNGDGTFSDVTAKCKLDRNNTRYSFCCGWADHNRDGWPDLYVVNDFGLKNLYRNNGDGTFTDIASEAGVEDAGAGMSVCWLDYDNDGSEDLYVANMWTAAGERITHDRSFQSDAPLPVGALYRKHAMGNSLFQNTNGKGFHDVTEPSHTGLGRWSWSSDSWDFDHDGFPDIYVANGMISGTAREDLNSFFWRQVVAKSPNTAKPATDYEEGWKAINELIRTGYSWSGFERNILYANNHDGSFSDISGTVGLDFVEDGRAFALADFDGDGRQELLLKNRNSPQVRLMKNIVLNLPSSIAIRLRGTESNRDAIGAVVTIHTASGHQTRSLQAGSGFLSQHSKELFFGLGDAQGPLSVTVRWPSGHVQELTRLPPNHRVSITESSYVPLLEAFRPHSSEAASAFPAAGNSLPDGIATWLLVPVAAPSFSLSDFGGKSWSVAAMRGKPLLLGFFAPGVAGSAEGLAGFERIAKDSIAQGMRLMAVTLPGSMPSSARFSFPVLRGTDDVFAIYSLLFRYLFDRHRDLCLPAFFLIDETGQVVKVYQGRIDPKDVEGDWKNIPRTQAERVRKALPFPGLSGSFEGGRNYLSLGSIFFGRGYVECAEEFFRSALKENPGSAEALYGIGSAYLRQNKNGEAREWFQKAVSVKASYPETEPNAWNNLGLLAAREGDMATAITCFQQSLRQDPDHFVTLENLGNAYRQQKRWDEARNTLQHALSLKPSDPEANYSLGLVFAQLNETDRAYEHLQKALRAKPIYPEALNNLGVLYLRTQRRDQAVTTFEECIRVAPAFDQAYLNLARVYVIEGNSALARKTLRDLLAQHPNHASATQALSQIP